MTTYRLAVDGMGGDNAPHAIVEGVCQAAEAGNVEILVTGDEDLLQQELAQYPKVRQHIEIIHAADAIPMDAKPKEIFDKYPDSSMVKAAELVASGRADALISAGNTGALILSSAQTIPRIKGVHRTALAAVYPTSNELNRDDIFSLILDVGANIDVDRDHMIHFALMGNAYAQKVTGIEKPLVGLLNMGAENNKGGPKYVEVNRILEYLPQINFKGNIEGSDLMKGIVDVVVTEGFKGNIAVKTMEGVAEAAMGLGRLAFQKKLIWKLGMIMLSGGIRKIKKISDYQEYGGAPILGLESLVLKCHGRSTPRAIDNAIKLAIKCIRDDLVENIKESINAFEQEFTRPDYDHITGFND
ncbi:MAG: phosphate acyltransferase PlsX [Candidatus Marinimicrobia bacterium]|nr:phosphate acyltransferase PlsX [Candidatus Neomarinimicrobiota bacterium]MCF7850125.1 phosphate acyltransferase PlsX [Candidatus Neomarinimicrobiota bacterium]MCF7905096.1 phosphate acyltransferase PlsX [Candidatus Neomarinimicrobiota bacterium]